jgi:hypothetical protein
MTDELLREITNFYLNSGDFNGVPVQALENAAGKTILPRLEALISSRQIAIVFGDVHPNPHIRALEHLHPPEKQIEMLYNPQGRCGCVYPLPMHLKKTVDSSKHAAQPYTLALMLGEPQLTHRAFDLAVLEMYRNDPRYYYSCDDICGYISVRDEYFEKNNMPVSDQVLLQTFGFSYDKSGNKYVAVFLRYLANLSVEHQRLWQAREISRKTNLHPDYFRSSILGHFPENVSIYDAFIEELKVINKMAQAMGRSPLFRADYENETRPQEFASLLRPTARQYADFIFLIDKLISENIDTSFFKNEIPFEDEVARADGKIEVKRRGSIQILSSWLALKFKLENPDLVNEMLKTFREIRKLRQKPAHAIDENKFDQSYVRKQRDLMLRAYTALRTLRLILANHPRAKNVAVPDWLREGRIWAQ